MTKKSWTKKRIIIILVAIFLIVFALFAVLYYIYKREIRVIEPMEHMFLEEGVGRDKILVEIGYSIIMNGEDMENYLFVFENGDVYSGYYIDSRYADGYSGWEKLSLFYYMDDKSWDYLQEQYYLGRLSPCDLDGIKSELAQIDFVREDVWPEPQAGTGKGTQIQTSACMKTFAERTNEQQNNDIYVGHGYKGRMESDGIESLEWISSGSAENMIMYYNNEHAQNVIDIIKSTWAYEQWTNQIFGEDWEERIDLKDELEEGKL